MEIDHTKILSFSISILSLGMSGKQAKLGQIINVFGTFFEFIKFDNFLHIWNWI
jgi:hypothetical protein